MGNEEASNVVDLTLEEDEANETNEDFKVLATVNGIPLTEKELFILNSPLEWLNDEIINAFCSRISTLYPDIHCCSSFFFNKISEQGLDKAWLNRWKKSVKLPKRIIFIPINWGNSHWALVSLEMQGKSILRYHDSMMSSRRGWKALSLVKKALEFCDFLPEKTREKEDQIGVLAFIMSKLTVAQSESIEISMEIPEGQPQQSDGSSCGIFVCWWVFKMVSEEVDLPPPSATKSYREFIKDTILNK